MYTSCHLPAGQAAQYAYGLEESPLELHLSNTVQQGGHRGAQAAALLATIQAATGGSRQQMATGSEEVVPYTCGFETHQLGALLITDVAPAQEGAFGGLFHNQPPGPAPYSQCGRQLVAATQFLMSDVRSALRPELLCGDELLPIVTGLAAVRALSGMAQVVLGMAEQAAKMSGEEPSRSIAEGGAGSMRGASDGVLKC